LWVAIGGTSGWCGVRVIVVFQWSMFQTWFARFIKTMTILIIRREWMAFGTTTELGLIFGVLEVGATCIPLKTHHIV
jgi:hypothetical protein